MDYVESSNKWSVALLLSSAVFVSSCQTVSGTASGVTNGAVVSGEIAQSRYEYVFTAISKLKPVLARKNVTLQDVTLDASLANALPKDNPSGLSQEEFVRRLAELHIVGAGPYQLVHSDAAVGRLEYRSQGDDRHVAFLIRPPNESEKKKKLSFAITDIIGQTALSGLVRDTAKGGLKKVTTSASGPSIDYAEVARKSADEDATILSHFNSLPQVEQDREDILGLRALLRLRMGHDKLAKPLVEQGIIRYPSSAIYFSLASVLLQRADQYGDAQAELIESIMNQRFSRSEINASRKRVMTFLAIEKVI